jgi:hypothetical protein
VAKPPRISSILCGVAGEYFVAAELSRRGYIASITLRNTRGVDVLASNQDATRSVGIQVKTSQRGRPEWVLSSSAEVADTATSHGPTRSHCSGSISRNARTRRRAHRVGLERLRPIGLSRRQMPRRAAARVVSPSPAPGLRAMSERTRVSGSAARRDRIGAAGFSAGADPPRRIAERPLRACLGWNLARERPRQRTRFIPAQWRSLRSRVVGELRRRHTQGTARKTSLLDSFAMQQETTGRGHAS